MTDMIMLQVICNILQSKAIVSAKICYYLYKIYTFLDTTSLFLMLMKNLHDTKNNGFISYITIFTNQIKNIIFIFSF